MKNFKKTILSSFMLVVATYSGSSLAVDRGVVIDKEDVLNVIQNLEMQQAVIKNMQKVVEIEQFIHAITRLNMISGDLEKKTSNEDVKILIIDGNKQVKIIESYMSNSENDIIPSLINMYNQVLDEYKSYKVINGIQL